MKSNILILFCCFLFLASCQASFIEEYTLLPHPVDIKYTGNGETKNATDTCLSG